MCTGATVALGSVVTMERRPSAVTPASRNARAPGRRKRYCRRTGLPVRSLGGTAGRGGWSLFAPNISGFDRELNRVKFRDRGARDDGSTNFSFVENALASCVAGTPAVPVFAGGSHPVCGERIKRPADEGDNDSFIEFYPERWSGIIGIGVTENHHAGFDLIRRSLYCQIKSGHPVGKRWSPFVRTGSVIRSESWKTIG